MGRLVFCKIFSSTGERGYAPLANCQSPSNESSGRNWRTRSATALRPDLPGRPSTTTQHLTPSPPLPHPRTPLQKTLNHSTHLPRWGNPPPSRTDPAHQTKFRLMPIHPSILQHHHEKPSTVQPRPFSSGNRAGIYGRARAASHQIDPLSCPTWPTHLHKNTKKGSNRLPPAHPTPSPPPRSSSPTSLHPPVLRAHRHPAQPEPTTQYHPQALPLVPHHIAAFAAASTAARVYPLLFGCLRSAPFGRSAARTPLGRRPNRPSN